ncbi:cupin domain-containing protein [Thalassotalea sp. G20_0]|uniref:cupin domain-containing protein n=1 Tax=Thalassotalea sp. G20_0 TaxID=2821093 RepID=UPI001ADCB1E0|nr:cupin domain-containing protein [Thalassotalea sp. G20_0]MBO9492673.1 cupin domain-containing protein [Thalassotalea sp. G20_0]
MKNNLFEHIPEELPEELFETLQESGGVKIERIVSRGHTTPTGEWYDQPWDEWVVLLSGSAALEFDGERAAVTLHAGDYVMLPSGCRHRVAWTQPDVDTIWLAVHVNL